MTEAVDRAVAAGSTVVAAAGNNASDACAYSPANAASAITVGATNTGDQMAEYSNQGSCVDLMAPGDAIMSAAMIDKTSLQYGSGTSMAAPHVAGAAALYLEKNPLAIPIGGCAGAASACELRPHRRAHIRLPEPSA